MLCIPPEFSGFYIYERKGEKMKKAAAKKSGTASLEIPPQINEFASGEMSFNAFE